MNKTSLFAIAAAASLPGLALAQNPGPERLAAVEIRAERVADDLYVLFGAGGNIAVSFGEQGVLIVDTQFPELVPKIRAAIRELGGGDIDFVINTHWHFDHADGNKVLGPDGTWIVAQENARRMMMQDNVINLVSMQREQPAYPAEALPVMSFTDGMMFHFNGEQIELLHFGPAHTAGDTAVIFRGHNVVHMGDVFNNAGYPFMDAGNGGSLEGMIEFCSQVLERIDRGMVVVPGHGPVSDYADLQSYVEMLSAIRDRMSALIEDGATFEQVAAAQITEEWDEEMGDPANFIDRAYTSLMR